jgi:hypothetical protein
MGALRLDAQDLPRPDWGIGEPKPSSRLHSELALAHTEEGVSPEMQTARGQRQEQDLERRRTEQRTAQLRPSQSQEYEIVDEFEVAEPTPAPPVTEWEDALHATASNIESLAPPMGSREHARPESEESLNPGMVVVGAPPATHPERRLSEETVQSPIPVPPEARRPDRAHTIRRDPTARDDD